MHGASTVLVPFLLYIKVGALHNDVFHQIISGDNTGTVSAAASLLFAKFSAPCLSQHEVWDIKTGKLEFEFRRAHQD